MYTCVNLKVKYLKDFEALSNIKDDLDNPCKEYQELYYRSNFIKRYFLRRNVRLFINGTNCIGYVLLQPLNKKRYIVNSMYIKKESDLTKISQVLIRSIGRDIVLYYKCKKNSSDFNTLEGIGFEKLDGILLMEIETTDSNSITNMQRNITFQNLIKGKDEKLRCKLQNEIFNNMQRVPLTPQDISVDEEQDYYFDKGAIFMKNGEKYIGYGQIIIEKAQAYIVNLGILREYRNMGYGKILLNFLTQFSGENGFFKVKIKVNLDNSVAIKMYENAGFKVIDESYNWIFKN